MTQQSGNQFDDDLTVGMDDSESFSTGSIDLFEFGGHDESPIARLKTIILSIDWEINDDIMRQLDDELLDLSEIWAGDKIKLVYIQGLSKIGKYINRERAGAHQNAIKLLLTFYHNLEKIVSSSDSMSEEEKKQLLLADVKRFEQLKTQIGKPGAGAPSRPAPQQTAAAKKETREPEAVSQLKFLKALVLGLDWEINDKDLQSLSEEVTRLETTFSQSKPKLILLQGIGALTSYINKMRAQSNKNTFKLLHSFYGALEKITGSELAADDEKQLLLSEVSKFNAFKAEIGKQQTAPAQVVSVRAPADQAAPSSASQVDETETEDTADIDSRLDSVFGDTSEKEVLSVDDQDIALAGVNVETEADDDSDEEALPYADGSVAPALSDAIEESSFSVDRLADDLAPSPALEAKPGKVKYDEDLFPSKEEGPAPAFSDVSDTTSPVVEDTVDEQVDSSTGVEDEVPAPAAAMPLPGVDVETEADDDSDEESLPFEEGDLAPALAGIGEEHGFDADRLVVEDEVSVTSDLEDRLGAFFDDEVETSAEEWGAGKEPGLVETAEEVEPAIVEDIPPSIVAETQDDALSVDEVEEEILPEEEESPIETLAFAEEGAEESVTEEINEFLIDDEPVDEIADETEEALSFLDEEEELTPAVAETEEDSEIIAVAEAEAEAELLTDETEVTEPPEEIIAESEAVVTEEAVSALDEEEVVETPGIETDEEMAVVEDDSKEIQLSASEEEALETEGEGIEEEEIAGDGAEAIFVPAEAAVSEEEEVVFEAVDDDVPLDPLPGEEFVDESSEYSVLAIAIESLHDNVTEDGVEDLYTEVDRLRSTVTSSPTDKIFLQLISTVSQHIKGGDEETLSLLDEIFRGLVMRSATTEHIQKHLLACMNRVLRLQEKDK
ncbi:MAG: hypothetical protein K9K37_02960 [Desulfocapsa sp.]|nr:hypothetical protein [Desulfocapsa sp.]